MTPKWYVYVRQEQDKFYVGCCRRPPERGVMKPSIITHREACDNSGLAGERKQILFNQLKDEGKRVFWQRGQLPGHGKAKVAHLAVPSLLQPPLPAYSYDESQVRRFN